MLGPQFFHGTDANVHGSTLKPGTAIGRSNFGAQKVPDQGPKVFSTNHEDVAWRFAGEAARARKRPGRERVHEVVPSADVKPGAYHSDHMDMSYDDLAEHVSNSAKIVRTHDIKPGHQGTFPLNWHQFTSPQHRKLYGLAPVNHPNPEQVALGHPGGSQYGEHYKAGVEAQTKQTVHRQKATLF